MQTSRYYLNDIPEDTKIWRYMDLTKFLDLILNNSMYFRRIDKFEDPYEGYISNIYKTDVIDQYSKLSTLLNDSTKETLSEHHINWVNLLPAYAYASCWYVGDVESAAMWKLYGGSSDNCTAICSTVYDLKVALSEPNDGILHFRKVKYVNGAEKIAEQNYLNPMFEKRLSFSYENEFRVLLLKKKVLSYASGPTCIPKKEDIKNPNGILLDVNVSQLIRSIYISPTAGSNFKSIVEKVLKLSGIETIECIQSELYKLK